MKKFPSDGAVDRARALRGELTEAEKALWRMLRSRQFEGVRFRRQVPFGNYVADFASHEARLIIEIDGGQHDLISETEKGRTAFLEAEGYWVVRFWNNEVFANPEGIYAVIAEALRTHHPHPSPPPSRGRG